MIQDLLSLTLALTDRADKLSWLAILRAPWCGLLLADLQIITASSEQRTIWQVLQTEGVITELSEDAQKRLARMMPVIKTALQGIGRSGLRAIIETAWRGMGGPQLVTECADIDNADTFLTLLETDHYITLDRTLLLQQLAKLTAVVKSNHEAKVEVMTIHKAKGLEFDTVIVPDMAAGSRRDDPPLLLWQEQLSQAGRHQLLLATIQSKGQKRIEEPMYHYLWQSEKQRAFHETQRLLYVAATRAKKRLYWGAKLIGEEPGILVKPSSNSFLSLLWPTVEAAAMQYFQAMQATENTVLQPTPSHLFMRVKL